METADLETRIGILERTIETMRTQIERLQDSVQKCDQDIRLVRHQQDTR